MRPNIGLKFFLFAIVFCVFLFSASSCDKLVKGDAELSLSIDNAAVEAVTGSQFVTVACSADWTLTIDFKGTEPWASLSKESGKGNAYGVLLSYDENEGESERSLELVLKSGTRTTYAAFVQKAGSGDNPGGGDNPGSGGDNPDSVPGWMELPAMQDGLEYFNHHFSMKGKSYRNYSLGWDGGSRLARWVAYPLCGLYLGSQKRTDAWDYDPEVPRNEQPVLFKSYDHYDHDRGHQLPSGDRTCNREANVQTFYFSNMTPQVGRKLNQSIWQKLESQVRAIARNADTLYVVTGCIVEGSTQYDTDNDGNKCIVPTGYFKALLYYSKTRNTLGTAGYSSAAFYLENRSYDESNVNKSHCMSVDELERKTGLDFFANLQDVVETIVEKEDPADIPIWW